jgi:hypothetical protein
MLRPAKLSSAHDSKESRSSHSTPSKIDEPIGYIAPGTTTHPANLGRGKSHPQRRPVGAKEGRHPTLRNPHQEPTAVRESGRLPQGIGAVTARP